MVRASSRPAENEAWAAICSRILVNSRSSSTFWFSAKPPYCVLSAYEGQEKGTRAGVGKGIREEQLLPDKAVDALVVGKDVDLPRQILRKGGYL